MWVGFSVCGRSYTCGRGLVCVELHTWEGFVVCGRSYTCGKGLVYVGGATHVGGV